MKKENLDPELESLVEKVKLKAPSEVLMKDYLSGVNAKIDRSLEHFQFGFPQFVAVCAVGAVLAGLGYFIFNRPNTVVPATVRKPNVTHSSSVQPPAKLLSLEEEMGIIEVFAEEHSVDTTELLDDEGVFSELTGLDEVELSAPPTAQA